jgi:hypothetical protein
MCFDVLCLTKELRFVEERARCKEEDRAGQQTAVIRRKVRLTQRREYERYLSSNSNMAVKSQVSRTTQ